MTIRVLTAGESHGKLLNAIIEGLPSGLEIKEEYINKHLARRQIGYGRGGRMQIEQDKAIINTGVRHGKTIGSPVSLNIVNKDWENWKTVMAIEEVNVCDPDIAKKLAEKKIEHVRPGHADLPGAIKYNHEDIRNILERSSARETAIRVAVGAICLKLLQEFDIQIFSHVTRIGKVAINIDTTIPENLIEAQIKAEQSQLRCIDHDIEKEMIQLIDISKEEGDSLGGIVQIIAYKLPVGIGSHVHWDRRLDGLIAQAIMSVPAIKAVEIGLGKLCSELPGSKVHDQIYPANNAEGFIRKTNNAGGLEGGMTNGSPIVVNATMKPIPTLKKPLKSININTGEEHTAHYERSDVCAVPAAGVVCEAMLALVLAGALTEKFGGDSVDEMKNNFTNYKKSIKKDNINKYE